MSKRNKVLSLISLISNALIILFVFGAFVWSFFQKAEGELLSKGITSLKYYTVLSNLFLGVSAIPMLVFSVQNAKKGEIKTPLWAIVLKFAAVVATTITFLTVVVVFIPLAIKEGYSWFSLFSETNLFNHLITPLVGLLGFCLCEISPKLKFRHTPWGIVSVILYEIFYTFNYYFHWVDSGRDNPDYLYDWYGFTNGGKNPVWLVIIIGVVAAYLITLLVYLFNVVFQHVFHDSPNLVEAEKDDRYRSKEEASYDPGYLDEALEAVDGANDAGTKHDIPEEEEEIGEEDEVDVEIDEPEEKPAKKGSSPNPNIARYNGGARTYHISKASSGNGWQVRLANGKKAIKIFKTQKEAIDYAKGLSKSQGGSIRIHSMKGKLRK